MERKGLNGMTKTEIMQMRIDDLEKRNEELTNECNRLRDEMRKLIQENAGEKTHNERNAGRHKSYTNEQFAQAKEWKKAGKSYKQIGEILGLSKTTVHRMLNQK